MHACGRARPAFWALRKRVVYAGPFVGLVRVLRRIAAVPGLRPNVPFGRSPAAGSTWRRDCAQAGALLLRVGGTTVIGTEVRERQRLLVYFAGPLRLKFGCRVRCYCTGCRAVPALLT